jgi:hypothetical protein
MSIEGNPGYGCSGPSSENAICDCLGCNIERIAAATESIALSLAKKSEDACKDIDKCIDKIIEGIENKYGKALASNEQCRIMVQNGLGGTLEYALKCAGVAREECTQGCSPGEGAKEGGCCKTCGAEKCICKGFECVPVDEEPKEKWVGWCNRETLVTAVTKQNQPAPGPGFVQVALADSEQAALAQAAANCTKTETEPPIFFPPVDPLPTVPGGVPACNVFDYFDGTALGRLNAQAVYANLAQGRTRAWAAAGQVGLDGLNLANIGEVLTGIFQAYAGFDSIIVSENIQKVAAALGCPDPQFQSSISAMCAINSVASNWGFDPTPWMTPYVYSANAACRSHMITPSEATAAYLANGISGETLDAIYAVHGLCPQSVTWNLQAQQSKAIPTELARLRRRKIYDKEQYQDQMRRLGYLNSELVENLFKLTEQVPTLAEIIRMMVRDSDDTDLVNRFGLDTGFNEKYGRQLKEWSEIQGISEQHARYDWRAHWSIPSPTQLFEFWRRLRYNPKFGGKEKLLGDIKAAMIQQDILPYWHEHYLAVQFRQMRLVDVRRSFQIGAMTEAELVPSYLQLGFSDDDAEKMAKFTRQLRDRSVLTERPVKLWLRLALTRQQAFAELSQQGIPADVINKALDQAEPDFIKSPYARAFARGDITAEAMKSALNNYGVSDAAIAAMQKLLSLQRRNHPAIGEYEAGLVGKDAAGFAMIADGMDAGIAANLLKRVDSEVRISFLKRCQNGIKQRYLLGELDQAQAETELIQRGTESNRARQMVDWWGCELKSGEKQVSATTLCDWLARGAISSVDYLNRLERIGYSQLDAALMLEDCGLRLTAQQQAKAKKEAKEQATERNRVARILEQQARQTERYLAQQKANSQKAATLKQRREKTLLTAVEKAYPKLKLSVADSAALLRGQNSRLRDSFGLSIDQSLQILVTAANEFDGTNASQFADFVGQLAEQVIAENISGVPSEIYIPPSVNGATV